MSLPFLFDMAWKSVVISGVTLLLAAPPWSRTATQRGDALRLGAGLLLLLPVASLALPAIEVATAVSAGPAQPTPSSLPPMFSSQAGGSMIAGWRAFGLMVWAVYLVGLTATASRLLTGLWTLRRWTAGSSRISCPRWTAAFDHALVAAGGSRGISLLASDRAVAPLSWGWRNPVILIDVETLARPEDAGAVLAHELAHVRRRDWPWLMLTRASVALFWFIPLVWRLERELARRAEEAADSQAIGHVEPTRYAQTLLSCARRCAGPLVPANGIAGRSGDLARRIRAILDGAERGPVPASRWSLVAMIALAALATPLAALEVVTAPEPAPPAPKSGGLIVKREPRFAASSAAARPSPLGSVSQRKAKAAEVDRLARDAADRARAYADQQRVIGDVARARADQARADADLARVQAAQSRARADTARSDAARQFIADGAPAP